MIHPTAVVSRNTSIDSDVEIGPYSVIEDNVKIASGTKIGSFCTVSGHTIIGKNNCIFSHTVIGSIPQDLKYKGEKTYLYIGECNTIREFVTVNPGTGEGGKTVIGNNNLIMAYVHIAHDCMINDKVIIANVGTLAGHVSIDDSAIIGGLTGIHQFVRVGKLAIIGGCSKVVQDVPPYSICDGHPAKVRGLNIIGLKRAGFDVERRNNLKESFRILFSSGHPMSEAVDILKKEIIINDDINCMLEFIQESQRGVCL